MLNFSRNHLLLLHAQIAKLQSKLIRFNVVDQFCRIIHLEKMQIYLLPGHHDIVMEVSVNYPYFASASKDNTIKVWQCQIQQGKDKNFRQSVKVRCLAVVKPQLQPISSLTFSNSSPYFIVSVSQDKTMKKWSIPSAIFKSQKKEKTYLISQSSSISVSPHQKYINSVTLSFNDQFIATCSQDRTIKIFEVMDKSLEEFRVLKGHTRGVWSAKFNPAQKLLASCSGDMSIKVWDILSGKCTHTLEGHQGSVIRLEWILYGQEIISFGVEGVMKIWNVKKSKAINTIQCHEAGSRTWGTNYSEQYKLLLTGATDSEIILWKDVTRQKEQELAKNEELVIIEKQNLQNQIFRGNLQSAAEMAFNMGRNRQLFKILKRISNDQSNHISDPINVVLIDSDQFDEQFASNFKSLDKIETDIFSQNVEELIIKLLDSDSARMFEIIRDFNTRSQSSQIAQKILKIALKHLSIDQLFEIRMAQKRNKNNKKTLNNLKFDEQMEQIRVYTHKHKQRFDRYYKDQFLVKFILDRMDVLTTSIGNYQ